jgi:adenylate cyclase, class 2
MQFEVELKFPVDDVTALLAQLRERGLAPGPPILQVDQYFAHPSRDFARTDEALRLRTIGGESFVTYKGPKRGTGAKTRQEIELPLDSSDPDGTQFAGLLHALGFTPVAMVRKSRRHFTILHDGDEVHGALDSVDELGDYLELEVIADESGIEVAQRTIQALAEELALGSSERRSYLELLLAR